MSHHRLRAYPSLPAVGPILLAAALGWGCGDVFSSSCRVNRTCAPRQDAGGLGGGGEAAEGSAAGEKNSVLGSGDGGIDGRAGAASSGLKIVTEALPAASWAQPYSYSLIADGGSAPLSWVIVSGELPNGVFLSGDGTLSGEPQSDGDFAFEVEVQDRDGASVSRQFSLLVLRKRWLAYTSDDANLGHDVLYAVDVTAGYAKSTITPKLGPGDSVGTMWWSPDGTSLAYAVSSTDQGEGAGLYVVDMRRETIGLPKRVSDDPDIGTSLKWSPDSRKLAYTSRLQDAVFELRYVDLSSEASPSATTVGVSDRYVWSWVGDNVLASRGADGLTFYSRDGDVWSAPRSLPIVVKGSALSKGTFVRTDPSKSVAWFGQSYDDCTAEFALVDFSIPSFDLVALDVSPSRDMRFFAGWAPDEEVIKVLDSGEWDPSSASLSLGPTADCEFHAWLPVGNSLVTLDASGRVVVSNVSSMSVDSNVVPGTYPQPTTMRFSSNGELLLLVDGQRDLFMSRLAGAVPATAKRVNRLLPSGGKIAEFLVAPDGSAVSYIADQDNVGQQSVYIVNEPGAWRTVSPSVKVGGYATDLAWSADSKLLTFKTRLDSTAPARLYIADARAPAAKAIDLTPGLACSSTCESVTYVRFQP